jgi:hypothetical protein
MVVKTVGCGAEQQPAMFKMKAKKINEMPFKKE